ncbi:MAG: Ig-like domain-containing protein, partial [Rhodoferax sp.]|nr:Ig-like domain-containing protein [Rhodoferax sp.]
TAELSSDMNGTPVNVADPNLRLAYTLNGNLQSSLPNQPAATAKNFLTADTPQFLAPNATLSESGNVQSVQVTVSGVQDGAFEKLSAGGSSIAADGSVTSGTVTVAATGAGAGVVPASTWTWVYVAGVATGTGTFTFTAVAGGVSSSAAQNLLRSLAYSDTATTPTAGNRGFSITATDVVGNTSSPVTATLNRALTSQLDLDSNSNGNDFSNPALNVSLVNTAQGSPVAPNAALLTSGTSVSRIQVRLGGAGLDLVNDKLVLNGTAAGGNPVTVALDVASSSASATDISIGGIGGLRYSYNNISKLLIITATSGSIAAADVDDIVKALLFRNALGSPGTVARTFEVSVVNMAGEGPSSASTLTLVDDVAPATPTLTLGSGVANGAIAAEATASSGVVLVNAESGSTVRVTFTDSSIPSNSFVKTVTGTGSALAIALNATDLGTGVGKLNDGTISVSAVVTDGAGNVSATGQTSLKLDTQAPAEPALVIKSGQDSTITSNETSIDIEVSYSGMVAGDVITLRNGASPLGNAYTVVAADVTAGKTTINVLSSLLGADGSKSITARVTDAAGNLSGDSPALALTVNNAAPGIVIKAGQDAYLNAMEDGIDLEVRTSQLAAGDTIQIKVDGSTIVVSTYSVTAADVSSGRVNFKVGKDGFLKHNGSNSGSNYFTAEYTKAGNTTTSPPLIVTFDFGVPSALALAVKSGENATINATETGVNLELTGTNIAEGDLVTLKNGNTILVNAYRVTAADVTAGKVALTVPAAALGADGVKSLTAEVRDAAGNSGTSGTLSVTLDTQSPLLGLQPGSGADVFINSTEAAAVAGVSVSVTGVSVGDVITIKEGATVLSGPTTLTAAMITVGTFSTTFARSQLSANDGIKTLSVFATDAAGNAARANQLGLLVDTSNPAALTVTTPVSLAENTVHVGTALTLPSGASAWQISGTDARFFMVDGNQLRFIAAPDADRPRGAPFNAGTNANAYSITLTAVDAAGNTANGAAAQAMTVNVTDVVAETAPVLNLQPDRSSGVSFAEASSGLGVLAVAAAANATVTVVFSRSGGGTVTKTLTQDANGAPTAVLLTAADLAALGDGTISVTSSAGAVAGLNTVTFTLDTIAPTGVSLTVSPLSGSLFNTATNMLTLTANFTGLADGDTLTLMENGMALKQTFTVSNAASGTQSLTLARYWLSLGDGVKSLTLVATDAAGNSTASTALNLTVDTTVAPTLRSNALINGVDASVNRLQLAVDDALGSDTSTSNGVSTSPYIHITGLDAGSSWQYSLDSGVNWTTVAAHNPSATDATLTLPASSTPYASGTVQVRQVDAS